MIRIMANMLMNGYWRRLVVHLQIEVVKIVLWGVWFWRNKKVLNEKIVISAFAIDNSFKMFSELINAKKKQRWSGEI